MGHTEEAAGKTPFGVLVHLVHLAGILLACRLCWLLWQRQRGGGPRVGPGQHYRTGAKPSDPTVLLQPAASCTSHPSFFPSFPGCTQIPREDLAAVASQLVHEQMLWAKKLRRG